MSYEKHNFQAGDPIYAADINEMDAQIEANEGDITDLKADISSRARRGLPRRRPTRPASGTFRQARGGTSQGDASAASTPILCGLRAGR